MKAAQSRDVEYFIQCTTLPEYSHKLRALTRARHDERCTAAIAICTTVLR